MLCYQVAVNIVLSAVVKVIQLFAVRWSSGDPTLCCQLHCNSAVDKHCSCSPQQFTCAAPGVQGEM